MYIVFFSFPFLRSSFSILLFYLFFLFLSFFISVFSFFFLVRVSCYFLSLFFFFFSLVFFLIFYFFYFPFFYWWFDVYFFCQLTPLFFPLSHFLSLNIFFLHFFLPFLTSFRASLHTSLYSLLFFFLILQFGKGNAFTPFFLSAVFNFSIYSHCLIFFVVFHCFSFFIGGGSPWYLHTNFLFLFIHCQSEKINLLDSLGTFFPLMSSFLAFFHLLIKRFRILFLYINFLVMFFCNFLFHV